jgi:hypothetical protein
LTQWPIIFQVFGVLTAGSQFGVFFLFLIRLFSLLIPLAAFGFHLGTFFIMGISFWSLWALFPALYWRTARGARSPMAGDLPCPQSRSGKVSATACGNIAGGDACH